jgi:hypothetical protein
MLYQVKVTMRLNLNADSVQQATGMVKHGISLSLPLGDTLDDMVIEAEPELDASDLRRRFTDGPTREG